MALCEIMTSSVLFEYTRDVKLKQVRQCRTVATDTIGSATSNLDPIFGTSRKHRSSPTKNLAPVVIMNELVSKIATQAHLHGHHVFNVKQRRHTVNLCYLCHAVSI